MKAVLKDKLKGLLNNSDNKDIGIKAFSFFIFRIFGLLLGYVLTLVITRLFNAETWGLMALSFTFFLFVPIIGRMGTDVHFVKFFSKQEHIENSSGLFYKSLALSFIITLVLSVILLLNTDYLAVQLFKNEQLKPFLFWTFLALPFWTATLVCSSIPRAQKQNNWFAFLDNPGRYFLTLLFFLGIYIFNKQPVIAIKAHFFAIVMLSIIAFIKSRSLLGKIKFTSNNLVSKTLKESYPIMIATSGIVLLGILDTFFMGIYRTEEEVAIYNVTLKVAMLTQISLTSINSILAPKVAHYFQEGNSIEMKQVIAFSTKVNFFVSCFIIAALILLNKFILGIFGEEFKSGTLVLIILCMGQLVNSLCGSVGTIMQMVGRQKSHQYLILVALGLNVILNMVLIPKGGATGAAIATSISLAFWNIFGAIYLKNKMNIKTYYFFR